jgi:hypothetical protein
MMELRIQAVISDESHLLLLLVVPIKPSFKCEVGLDVECKRHRDMAVVKKRTQGIGDAAEVENIDFKNIDPITGSAYGMWGSYCGECSGVSKRAQIWI